MSLQEKLQELKANFSSQVPAEAAAIMARDGQVLLEQRNAANIPQVGQAFPAFSLADSLGNVQTRDTLAPGKSLVVSFFRGFW